MGHISLHLPHISPASPLHLPTSPYISPIFRYISPTSRCISLHLATSRLLALLTLGTRKALRVGELHAQWRGHDECRAAARLEAQLVEGVAGAAALLRLGLGLGLRLGSGLGLRLPG